MGRLVPIRIRSTFVASTSSECARIGYRWMSCVRARVPPMRHLGRPPKQLRGTT